MAGLGFLREENAERKIFYCASLRSGLGVEYVSPKSEAFRAILAALPVVKTRAECIWRGEECGGMTGLKVDSLQLKIIVKNGNLIFFSLFFCQCQI